MYYFYVVVRKDIPLGDQLCQVAHASSDAGREFKIPEACNVVVLSVENKEELLTMAERLDSLGIRYRLQIEPDDDLGETSLATEMVSGDLRQPLRQYKLWRAA